MLSNESNASNENSNSSNANSNASNESNNFSTYEKCINIIEDKKTLNHNDLKTKWENFKTKYPRLYEMLTVTENIDLKLLKFLCDSAEAQLEKTKEQQLETDFEIGDKLAQKFIYEKFPEPSNQQKEFIKETLRKKLNNGD